MKTQISTALVFSMLALAACSAEQRATDLPPGSYEHSSSSKDANGTSYDTKKTTDVTVDEYGNKRAVVTTKTSKDPKGLFNKSTSKSKVVVDENN